MIVFENVSIRYTPQSPFILRDINLTLAEGQLVLIAGRTGSGKSTLLGAINGHVPHFTGGELSGQVIIDGLNTADHPPRELAHLVGVVAQDPLAGFVMDTVEEELAYGMEQLGIHPAMMRTRVEETLDILGLAELRRRGLRTLSGGQQQRVAIGAVLAAGVRTLVLDEPTSALDPVSAEDVLAALLRLVHDLGLTVVIAEHRLERVASYADQMVLLQPDGSIISGQTRTIMAASPLIPPVVELGRKAGFDQVPLSVREARQFADQLRATVANHDPDQYGRVPPAEGKSSVRLGEPTCVGGLVVNNLTLAYGRTLALKNVSLEVPAGMITVVMGRNGSGKSSLLWAVTGLLPLVTGSFSVNGTSLEKLSAKQIRHFVRLVPQTAADLLYLSSVAAECQGADAENGCELGLCHRIFEALAPHVDPATHPHDLSEGQKLALVLAIQLTSEPAVILLDEPTRGLDYPAKATLAQILAEMAAQGRAVGVVTHDVEFAAAVADRIIVMATGEVIQADAAATVLGTSALFAPQVAKVLYPQRWLTPYQVGQALQSEGTR
ncbi:MAG: ATP-binding cassette domain-containing protein [Propionibacteriaceae bacterium]|nr:ATP-binding cassette domain-containing protein [Propionibacteriaceae bacterium]